VRSFNIRPRVALLSYSNFGSSATPEARMMSQARELVKQRDPSLIIDGEMQGILAFNNEILKENYPFSELIDQDVNTLIFPNLSSGNIAYNLLKEVGQADAIGPVLLGMNKPVQVLQLGSTVRSIVNMTLIAVLDAQLKCEISHDEKEARKRKWWQRRKPEQKAQ
jgi:malate dehydrogenase (oxaloacetate-decarboxylating)(NADP+)